jgi:MFS family permease
MNNLLLNIPEIVKMADTDVRQQTIWSFTQSNPSIFYLFIVLTMLVVLCMGLCRSPAVALMPDVTPKPLRTKGNAIVTCMGGIGGVIGLALFTVLYKSYESNIILVGLISILMILTLVIFMITVKEPKLVKEKEETVKKYNIDESETAITNGTNEGGKKLSLVFALVSLFLCNFGYDAVSAHFTVYAKDVLDFSNGSSGAILMLATLLPLVLIYPIATLSDKLGRRRTIKIGLLVLALLFLLVSFVTSDKKWMMYMLYPIIGTCWGLIKVSQLPLVLEMSQSSNVGKYTGFYYLFSMSSQTITPGLVGFFMDKTEWGKMVLFPYAALFTGLAFVTMFLVKHGDAIKIPTERK